MMEKPFGYWKDVLWFDESKFNLFGSDGKIMMWRSTNEELSTQCTVLTIKHQGGSIMVWGCFSRAGVGNLHFIDGTVDRFVYREILEKNLIQSANKLGLSGNFVFQHSNDPKDRAVFVNDWLKKKQIEVLKWPSFSPDLNPTEHLWDELERRMKKHQPKNKDELKRYLLHEWVDIGRNVIVKLVDSVPNRLYECLKMKGYSMRY
ncbi:unnamed protein product [Rotaria magnacalcarata]|uniref:Tc1-like transposase DDE domain-containing protein n=1 Tax=Rotaria magnacalcarata TaxID=392030 RepID=A0A816U5S4_9BILA|nr:unnamed protein product [Rotaria magnacalcarata]CAF2092254.1 unnamed protein product [Rotaria magnacalcarata]CAF2106863.1 unnamed protein product [Rotaria magnacalcarata]CAF2267361.1 unnamed protein product [Rotaria magnacalcarata]CAF3847053.1 unnamed protein product [Rotaria magnacalcarata]